MGSDFEKRIRNVTAVLGPTNTGKTHLAIERMLGHESGMIGLPLRLLAREVYDKIAGRVGADKVALVTGEEKIRPERARYWVATVEAMPRDVDVDFLAIDEVQLAGDPERGHVFTDRLLHSRGRSETLLLGAQTMAGAINDLIPGANFISRPRLSKLTYSGEKKITRLPGRTAVVAFSANEVYAIAELIRRQRGGTAVVLGALSPRTRNAQVALYQSGDVEFLVATDAIGMGLNLDVDHVAFSAARKFDGQNFRNLTPGEIGQIAGRAGRHMNNGTFGVTGGCEPFDADLVERLETHSFDPIRVLQWRSRDLDFRSLERLRESLRQMPSEARLTRARMADDVLALETVSADREVTDMASSPAAVTRLWEVCQVPDYRKISSQNHAELVSTLYKYLMGSEGRINEDWFAKQVQFADRTDGDIDTLTNRIAHIRTWTFVANRADWLKDPQYWQGRTRAIEDSLSDALHECLTQRFVDRRTSALMRGMRDKEELQADIGEDGAITVENHYVGRLKGFRFSPETQAEGINGKAARHAAAQVLSRELGLRARRVVAAKPEALRLSRKGEVLWRDEEIARIVASDDPLKPSVQMLCDEHLAASDKEKVQARIESWLAESVATKLKPLADVAKAEDLTGLARGIAFRLTENFGALKREAIASELKSLDQPARAQLRNHGVRFGAFNIYFPLLLKPAASDLTLALWSVKHAVAHGLDPQAPPEPPRSGLTSVAVNPTTPEAYYRAAGYHVCGPRAVRFDILERLADQIRPLIAWRRTAAEPSSPPKGSTGDGGFYATPEMMSALGCSPAELGNVLQALGFKMERRLVVPAAATSAGSTFAGETATPEAAVEAAPVEASSVPVESGPVETAAAAPTAPTTESEPKYEGIWRPRRHQRGEERKPSRENRRERFCKGGAGKPQTGATAGPSPEAVSDTGSAAAVAPPAEGTAVQSPDQPRRDGEHHRQRHRHRGHETHQGGAARREGEGSVQPPPVGQPARHRDRDRGQGGGNRDRDRGGAPRQHGGGDRRRREDRSVQSAVISAAPPKKALANADSPFALLGALREALEKRAKEKSS